MKRIEKLMVEQEARIPEYVEWGIKVGLCTDRISPKKAEAYTKKLNEYLKRPVGKTLIGKGPKEAWKLVLAETGKKEVFTWPWLDGQFFSYWVAWANFFRDVVGLKLSDYSVISDQLEFGLVYPLASGTVVYSDRPLRICVTRGVLHNESAPSVEYGDGTRVWSLHGVRCPKELVETAAEKLDCIEWMQERNVEVRREFVRKVGVERLLVKLGSKKLDTSGEYELHEIDLGGATGKWPALKMKNPSIGIWHVEWVARECRNVKVALEWRNHGEAQPSELT